MDICLKRDNYVNICQHELMQPYRIQVDIRWCPNVSFECSHSVFRTPIYDVTKNV